MKKGCNPSHAPKAPCPPCFRAFPRRSRADGVAIIVNDKSPDGTGEVAERLENQWPGLDVVSAAKRGGAQKTGLRRGLDLGAHVFAVIHADGQYAPEVVLDLMKPILEGKAQIVQAPRIGGGGALAEGCPTLLTTSRTASSHFWRTSSSERMAEFHSGYHSTHHCSSAVRLRNFRTTSFDAEMIILAHLIGMRCAQISIRATTTRFRALTPSPTGINVIKMMARHLRGNYRDLVRNAALGESPAEKKIN